MSIFLCFSFVFQEWGRTRSQVKLCQLWATLIIEEGRRGENGCCNIHMSYWLDCQLLAHAHSTYEAPQMTEDAKCCVLPQPPPTPPFLLCIFPFFDPSIHVLTCFFQLLSLHCHHFSCLSNVFFLPPSHLLPFLRRGFHAHGPNSITDQIKEMHLNFQNRQKNTHAPDLPEGSSPRFQLCSLHHT